jgi:hypothetical protein
MSGAHLKRWMLIGAGTVMAAPIGGFLVAVLIMSSPSHRGLSRSAPHSTTD